MRLLLLAAFFAVPLAHAQSGEAFVQQADIVLSAEVDEAIASGATADEALARALVGAPESSNVAVVDQRGAGNVVRMLQDGTGNLASVVLAGAFNQLDLVQAGRDNVFVGDIVGDGNRLVNSSQLGDGNSYSLFLEGVNGTTHSLYQVGDDNAAVQYVGPGLLPASIEQRGGAEVTIVRR
ncbi:hypothetical protein [Rubrivirga marina]|uniref:Curlin n=1 Tax=Rubrivirga marina TaxID=1196024 RepID=A0A271J2B0_9BACT|nr:hypothetical protein [Rubrivirga marina]PAP77447.1 hypothetical protein BSZ37_13880 [Rubrivirga marina]